MSKDLEPDACPFEAGREGIRRMTEEVLEIGEREGIIKKMNIHFKLINKKIVTKTYFAWNKSAKDFLSPFVTFTCL